MLTYSISGGPDAAKFNIDPASGQLSFKVAPDFENPGDVGTDNVYNVTVAASDGELTTTQNLAITVTDVADSNRPPEITSPAAVSVAENQTAVLTVTAVDPDDGGVPPAVWTPLINGSKVVLFGAEYEVESANNATFKLGNAIKFILRPGESWPEDISGGSDGHRAELDGYKQVMQNGQTWWAAWQFRMDPGAQSQASWLFQRQYHSTYNHEIKRSTQKMVMSRPNGTVSAGVPLVYGQVYNFVDKIKAGTGGSVTTWCDGVKVHEELNVNVSGNRYPKFGLYGDNTDPATLVVRFDNFEFTQTDLTARITTPRSATPGWLT